MAKKDRGYSPLPSYGDTHKEIVIAAAKAGMYIKDLVDLIWEAYKKNKK